MSAIRPCGRSRQSSLKKEGFRGIQKGCLKTAFERRREKVASLKNGRVLRNARQLGRSCRTTLPRRFRPTSGRDGIVRGGRRASAMEDSRWTPWAWTLRPIRSFAPPPVSICNSVSP